MEITLGPILYEWRKEDVRRFYEEAASWAIDRVCIGEVVCVKKRGVPPDALAGIAEGLERAGKKVAVSSLAVISNEDELSLARTLSGLPYAIEANDAAIFNMVDAHKKEVFAGPHVLSYNAVTIEFLKGIGVKRITMPVELSRESVEYNIARTGVPAEVFAHGKAPLAFSWRCYTSRAYGLNKTDCAHHCARHPSGMEIKTLDAEPVFTVNGTAVLSASTYTLIEHVEDLAAIGVGALRISPELNGTGAVVDIFRRRIKGEIGPEEGLSMLREASGGPRFSNGWYFGRPGKDYIGLKDAETKQNL